MLYEVHYESNGLRGTVFLRERAGGTWQEWFAAYWGDGPRPASWLVNVWADA